MSRPARHHGWCQVFYNERLKVLASVSSERLDFLHRIRLQRCRICITTYICYIFEYDKGICVCITLTLICTSSTKWRAHIYVCNLQFVPIYILLHQPFSSSVTTFGNRSLSVAPSTLSRFGTSVSQMLMQSRSCQHLMNRPVAVYSKGFHLFSPLRECGHSSSVDVARSHGSLRLSQVPSRPANCKNIGSMSLVQMCKGDSNLMKPSVQKRRYSLCR